MASGHETIILTGSPNLAVLATSTDEVPDWIRTGQALARLLLYLTSKGIVASHLNQPIETASLRQDVKTAAGVKGTPQILLRLGRAAQVPPPTMRREVRDVIQQP